MEGTVEQVCRQSPRIGERYGRIRLSTVGRLRTAGFAMLATFDRPHFDVVLPGLDDATITGLEGCFDPPIANPGKPGPPVS
jgi:hypothetical protein